MNTKQPEVLGLADWLEAVGGGPSAKRCAALLREQQDRITELESQLAQRFDAADVATASAQGFRDGAASLAASVGSELVYQARYQKGFWQDSSRERYEYLQNPENTCAEDWETRILYTHPSPPEGMAGWTTLPGQTPTDAATPECLTCNDHGAVGNILTAEPCPDCTPTPPAADTGAAQGASITAGMEPAATVRTLGVVGVKFSGWTDYGCSLPDGTKLYTEAQVQAQIAAAPQPSPPADSVHEDAAREAIEKVLALFPFNVPSQQFTVNNGPCLTADNDDEFYSVKRVLAILTEIKTTLDAARKQGARWQSAVRALTLHI